MSARAASEFEGLLAEAGRLLAASLDLDETLRTIARLALPEFADWAVVDFIEPDGTLRAVSSGHPDPETDRLVLAVRARWRDEGLRRGETPAGALTVLATGEPLIYATLPLDQIPTRSDEERERWSALHPVSWLIAPLRAGDETVGAITFLTTRRGRPYDEGDFPVALELAERCGQALGNARLYDEARSGHALLDTVFTAAPVAMSLLDGELRTVLSNARMRDLDLEVDDGVALRVITSGSAVVDVPVRADERSFEVSAAPVELQSRVIGVICAVVETTERQRLLDRTARLQAVTEQLSAALTADQVARVVLAASTEATGASCGVLGVVDGDALRVEHRVGAGDDAPVRIALSADAPMPLAARRAAPVVLGSREAWLQRFPAVPPRGEFETFAAVPLVFEERVAGVMGVGFDERDALGEDDVELLVAIARLAAQALERARLYEERAYVARTLQAGLLPRALPDIDGFELGVRYRPLGDGSEVGGDFYDVVELDDGSWLVAVGDICGKGTAAAVLTGVMRSTIRALAVRETDVGALVRGVNEALLRERSPLALASLACATICRTGDGRVRVTAAAGGHPPPLVLRAGGTVDVVAAHGPMLGVQRDLALTVAEETLGAGDLLLLYTDGIIDARRNGRPPFGEDRLREALAAGAGRDAQGALDGIDAAIRAYAPGPPRDDKALLAVRAAA